MKYKIIEIQFKNWGEYLEKVNAIEGYDIDETLIKLDYGYGVKNRHTIRLKKISK